MAKVLILFFHPLLEKSRINRTMIAHIPQTDSVLFRDMYEIYPDFNIDVRKEQSIITQADVLLFQHPFYWYSCPPLMKQWIDMVLEFNWAYGPLGRALAGKYWMQCISAGGSMQAYQAEGSNKYSIRAYLRPFEQTARLCKMHFLPPVSIHGTHRLDDAAITNHALHFKSLILQLVSFAELPEPSEPGDERLWLQY